MAIQIYLSLQIIQKEKEFRKGMRYVLIKQDFLEVSNKFLAFFSLCLVFQKTATSSIEGNYESFYF